jgi:hypothetical protein
MKIDGVWIMESLARFGLDLDFGLAAPPMPADELAKGRSPISWVGGWAYAIPSTAKEKDGAWELMRFLVSRRSLRIVAASSEHSAAAQGQLYMPRQNPNREHNEWLHQTRIEDNPALPRKFKDAMRVFNDLLETSRYRPVTPVGQKLWNAQIWAMEDAIFGKKTAQEALDYYTAIVQRDLDAALNPPPGRPIRSWGWFFAFYAALLAGVGFLVVRNDIRGTVPSARTRILRFLSGENAPPPAVVEGRKGSYFRAQWKDGVICALPWILGFIFFTGGPLLFSIVISFSRFDILSDAVFIGLDNYRFMLTQDELFWKSLGNTLFMVIGVPSAWPSASAWPSFSPARSAASPSGAPSSTSPASSPSSPPPSSGSGFQSPKRSHQPAPRLHRPRRAPLAAGRSHQQMGAHPHGPLDRRRRHDHLDRRHQGHQRLLLRGRFHRRRQPLAAVRPHHPAHAHPLHLLQPRHGPHRHLPGLHPGLHHDLRRPRQLHPLLRLPPLQQRLPLPQHGPGLRHGLVPLPHRPRPHRPPTQTLAGSTTRRRTDVPE